MPRIMTMNGDQQSVATAPLDLRTTTRERGSDAGVTRGSPACTGADRASVTQDSDAGAARRRPADKCPQQLPFRKRRFPAEPETQRRSPSPADGGERASSADDADLAVQENLSRRLERIPVTPRRFEETGQSLDGCPVCLLPCYSQYSTFQKYQVYCLPPETNHSLAHQTEGLLPSVALATHQDEDGDTALHIAVVQGEVAMVCKLIDLLLWAHRSLDIYNNLRQTPLHLAVITQQPNMVGALLRAGADPAVLDRNGQTALHLCCEYNQAECLSVVLTLSSTPTCLESRNYEGLTALHVAVLRGHKALARMLLDARADINAMDIKSGQSPLMHAVESNNADMVHFLIENGCDVNSQSYSGNTALHNACGRGQADTVRLLLKSGAESSLKNYHNDTPVMVAKNKKIADVLRGRGSKPRGQDQHSGSGSPHGSTLTENGSPSSNHSRECSPSTTPHAPHHTTSHSPKTPSALVFPYY